MALRCNLEHITQQDAFNDSVYEFGNELLKLIEELFARGKRRSDFGLCLCLVGDRHVV